MVTFVDEVTLHLKAGQRRQRLCVGAREKFKPLAGPDGANGGDGGDIVLVADPQTTTLLPTTTCRTGSRRTAGSAWATCARGRMARRSNCPFRSARS